MVQSFVALLSHVCVFSFGYFPPSHELTPKFSLETGALALSDQYIELPILQMYLDAYQLLN